MGPGWVDLLTSRGRAGSPYWAVCPRLWAGVQMRIRRLVVNDWARVLGALASAVGDDLWLPCGS
jgi:hypothetical protein